MVSDLKISRDWNDYFQQMFKIHSNTIEIKNKYTDEDWDFRENLGDVLRNLLDKNERMRSQINSKFRMLFRKLERVQNNLQGRPTTGFLSWSKYVKKFLSETQKLKKPSKANKDDIQLDDLVQTVISLHTHLVDVILGKETLESWIQKLINVSILFGDVYKNTDRYYDLNQSMINTFIDSVSTPVRKKRKRVGTTTESVRTTAETLTEDQRINKFIKSSAVGRNKTKKNTDERYGEFDSAWDTTMIFKKTYDLPSEPHPFESPINEGDTIDVENDLGDKATYTAIGNKWVKS
jgi:hypothetical protein